MNALQPEFQFAGFTFPRYIAQLYPKKTPQQRAESRAMFGGGYYYAPKPIVGGAHPGQGFYLAETAGLRWQWCDEVLPSIRHTGWYSDEFGDGDKIRGLVLRLNHARGFLAGWSMGEGMASEFDGEIHDTAEEAARAANSCAENVAEREREYQAEESAKREAEEEREEAYTTLQTRAFIS